MERSPPRLSARGICVLAKDLLQSARYIEGSLGLAGKWVRRQKRVRDVETAPRAQKTANSGKVHLSIHNAQPQMCSSANKADRAKSRCEFHCMEFAAQDSAHTGQRDLRWALVVPHPTASWFLIWARGCRSSFFPVYVSEAAQVVQTPAWV